MPVATIVSLRELYRPLYGRPFAEEYRRPAAVIEEEEEEEEEEGAMICALCGRRISRRKVAARQYVSSRHTRNYYCGPGDWQRCSQLRRQRMREAPAA